VFDYDYGPGFGDKVIGTPPVAARSATPLAKGAVRGNTATLALPNAAIQAHLNDAQAQPLAALVTLPHPSPVSSGRSFDVLVNAPANLAQAATESPFYAGTIAFFGAMTHMTMRHDATFVVPLPKRPEVFAAPAPLPGAKKAAPNATALTIRLVP